MDQGNKVFVLAFSNLIAHFVAYLAHFVAYLVHFVAYLASFFSDCGNKGFSSKMLTKQWKTVLCEFTAFEI